MSQANASLTNMQAGWNDGASFSLSSPACLPACLPTIKQATVGFEGGEPPATSQPHRETEIGWSLICQRWDGSRQWRRWRRRAEPRCRSLVSSRHFERRESKKLDLARPIESMFSGANCTTAKGTHRASETSARVSETKVMDIEEPRERGASDTSSSSLGVSLNSDSTRKEAENKLKNGQSHRFDTSCVFLWF